MHPRQEGTGEQRSRSWSEHGSFLLHMKPQQKLIRVLVWPHLWVRRGVEELLGMFVGPEAHPG